MRDDFDDLRQPGLTWQECLGPLAVGCGVGATVFLAPESWAGAIVVGGAVLAGWALPKAPMVAALVYLVPTAVLGAVRLVVDVVRPDDGPDGSSTAETGLVVGGVIVGIIAIVLSTAIFTHVGAIVARRRSERPPTS